MFPEYSETNTLRTAPDVREWPAASALVLQRIYELMISQDFPCTVRKCRDNDYCSSQVICLLSVELFHPQWQHAASLRNIRFSAE
jgi:hypothetical protein